MKIAILGAGDLGATVARQLAETGLCHEIVLFDPALGTAQGKALDILESGPVLGFRTQLSGATAAEALGGSSLIISAGGFGGDGQPVDEARADAFLQAMAPLRGDSLFMVAEDHGTRLAELAVLLGHYPPRSVLGSAPLAWASSIRMHLARELDCSARDLQLPLIGMLPSSLIVPWSMVALSGIPVEKLTHVSVLRRLASWVGQRRPLGPYLLASAAVALARDILADRHATHPVLAYLRGEYQQRDRFLVVPARVGRRGVSHIPELALDPVDRVALERLRRG